MMFEWLRACAVALIMASATTLAMAQTAPAEIPVQTLFKKAAYRALVLSPDQKHLAAVASDGGRQNLVVIDIDKRTGKKLTGFTAADVSSVYWANNTRLIYTTGDDQGLEYRGDGGLYGIDIDGGREQILFAPLTGNGFQFVVRLTTILGRVKGRPDELYVSANDRSLDSQSVYRMNIYSGQKTQVNQGSPGKVIRWIPDNDGVPRVALSMDEKKKRWWVSTLVGSEWKTIAEWDEQLKNVVIPRAFDPGNNGVMYVASNVGRDTLALFTMDPKTGKLGDLVFGDDRYDISSFALLGSGLGEGGNLIFGGTDEDPKALVGLEYRADKLRRVWFDKAAAQAQATVDAALPDSTNSFSVNQRRTLVFSRSDVNPGEWFIFDRDKLSLEETGVRARPELDSKQMAPMRPVSWMARDGVRIDGYLTLPLNYRPGSPLPLVLHPHGGPWAKDNWGFNPEVQFMANRGYAVLQPNFRGSTGYGAQHLRLSFKHWGDTMIDDMIDGVEWAVKQGYADPNRVGVYGASYGGYATLMALVRRPDLFKWGINYVGVTDMTVHQDTQWAQTRGDFFELAKALNGDQNADKALFEAQSPARHVSQITAPVFHAYGGNDYNVDYANGRTIRAAFDAAKKPYEWMFVEDEGHGYHVDKNSFEFYTRFDRFIKKNTPPKN